MIYIKTGGSCRRRGGNIIRSIFELFQGGLTSYFGKHTFCCLITNGKLIVVKNDYILEDFKGHQKKVRKITGGALEFDVVLSSKHACY